MSTWLVPVVFVLLLMGCKTVPEAGTGQPGSEDGPVTMAPPQTWVSDTGVKTMAVDVRAGLPERLTPVRKQQPYPVMKQGAAFADARPWLRLQLNPALSGPLAPVLDSPLPAQISTQSVAASLPPVLFCATGSVAMPMDAGPRQNWVIRQVKSLGEELWRSWFDDEEEAGISVEPDPLSALSGVAFELADVNLLLKGRVDETGLVLSGELTGGGGKPVVHQLYLERRDCQRAWPDRFQVHGYWQEDLSDEVGEPVLVTRKQGAGGFRLASAGLPSMTDGELSDEEKLSYYQRHLQSEAPEPVWKQLGFLAPEGGARWLSSRFTQLRERKVVEGAVLVLHVAVPVDTRYSTEVLVARLSVREDGTLAFVRL